MKKIHAIALTLIVGAALSLIHSLSVRTSADGAASKARPSASRAATRQAFMSEQVSVHAAGLGRPLMNLGDGHDLITAYSAMSDKLQLVDSDLAQLAAQAQPLALASGDFDEDGVPDLISSYAGYAGVAPAAFFVLHRGNVDSIYPNTREAEQRKARGEFTDAPFLSPARVFEVPTKPDFIGAGDFDADGHLDVVMAARGGNQIYWMAGDGHGGFGSTHVIELPGRVTAMTVGEINRRDGLADVVVGITDVAQTVSLRTGSSSNSQTDSLRHEVLVFEGPEGALKHDPEVIALPAPATSLALGQLDDSYEMDLAVAVGNDLVIVHGRDRKLSLAEEARAKVAAPEVETREMPFTLSSIAIGNFTRNDQDQIAALSDDGVVHVIERSAKQAWGKVAPDIATPLQTADVSVDAAKTDAMLVKARVSVSGFDDLAVVDSVNRQLHIFSQLSVVSGQLSATDNKQRATDNRITTLDVESDPVAILPMRLNSDALSDLVVLKNGGVSPLAIAPTVPLRTFTVNSTGNQLDANPGDGICETAKGNGVCTLAAAIQEVNAGPGGDAINFSVASINVNGTQGFSKPVTVDGGSNRVEISGGGFQLSCFSTCAGNSVIRGLVINKFVGNTVPLIIDSNAGNVHIENNYIGTDTTGTNTAWGNSTRGGIQISGSPSNFIGGPAAAARNVIAMPGDGVDIGIQSPGTFVQGNYIGTDASGTKQLSGNCSGIGTSNSGGNPNQTIGGTTSGAGNLIACSSDVSIGGGSGGSGYLVQGNLLGTDATGAVILISSSGASAVNAVATTGLTIGGTTPAARNVIVGNLSSAVNIGSSSGTLIQGNYIGTDVSGTKALPNNDAIAVDSFSTNTTIGGTIAGARNLISGNTGSAIFTASGGVTIQGNYIGTDVTGTNNLGNSGPGISVGGANNLIGGTTTALGNIIAFSKNSGGVLISGTGNAVRRNSIFGNHDQAILCKSRSSALLRAAALL